MLVLVPLEAPLEFVQNPPHVYQLLLKLLLDAISPPYLFKRLVLLAGVFLFLSDKLEDQQDERRAVDEN